MHVALICIVTLDGKIAPADFGSPEDRHFLEERRERTDASLLGGESLRVGDPEMRGKNGRILENRIRALITASGKIPLNRKIFTGSPPLIFTGREKQQNLQDLLGKKARIVALAKKSEQELDLSQMIIYLKQAGATSLLIEGGGRLNYSALRAGIVDELLLTLAPKISGRAGTPALADGETFLAAPFLNLTLKSCRQATSSGELFLRYSLPKRHE